MVSLDALGVPFLISTIETANKKPSESQLQQCESTAILDFNRAEATALWSGIRDSTVAKDETILE
ncbi:hypothetical protein SDJN02_16018, partial [Cucurbita argyrosperma subsp. argyrosperma]